MSSSACAASVAVADPLTGPPRSARVAAVLDAAVYLATDDPTTPAVCLVLPNAVRVPCAVVVGGGPLPKPQIGADAQLGAGRVLLDGVAFRIGRWWQPPRPNDLARAGAVRLAGAADAVRRVVAQPLDVAGRDALAQLAHVLAGDSDPAHLAGPVGLLLGRGVGLTPVGDDVLAGMLVTLRALAHPAADRLADRVRAAAPRATTVVSAALLHHAARGECVPQLASLLNAIAHGGRINRPLDALLQVGRTSGAGLAWGVAAALDTSARSADDTAVGSHDDLATPSHPVADGPPRGRIAR